MNHWNHWNHWNHTTGGGGFPGAPGGNAVSVHQQAYAVATGGGNAIAINVTYVFIYC